MHSRFVIISALFFALSFGVYGQVSNSSYSSRSKKMGKYEMDQSLSLNSLLDSADYYLKIDRNKAFDFLENAYLLSLGRQYYADQYRVLLKLGEYYEYYKQPDLAAINYENALKKLPPNVESFEIVLLTGKQYLKSNYPRRTLAIYRDFTKNFTENQKVKLLESYGDVYVVLQKNDSALLYFRKAETLSEKLNMNNENLAVKLKIAKILALEDSDKQYDVLNKLNIQSKASNNQQMVIESESELADYYQKNEQVDQEIVSRNTIITELKSKELELKSQDYNVDSRLIQEQISLGKIYFQRGNYNEAIEIFEAIFEKTYEDSTEVLGFLKEAAKLRSEAYQKTGQEQKALRSYEEYSLILNKLYQQAELNNDSSALLSNQLRDHQWRIDFLEKDKTIYDSEMQVIAQEREIQEQKLKYQYWSIILLGAVILLLIISLVLLILKYRIQQKHNAYLALKSLRIQMNPHFIFNALNSINNFIVKNDELNANKYLARFSKLMRSILNNSELDFIPLEKEIEILELYLQIEHMRFPDKFQYDLNIDESVNIESFSIPPMLIQPYIENAVWHGLRYLETGGKLSLTMEMEGEYLKVCIMDNGIGRKKSMELKTKNQKATESKGIKNTQGRLDILAKIYKKEIRQKISDLNENGEGTKVEIWIPNLNQ